MRKIISMSRLNKGENKEKARKNVNQRKISPTLISGVLSRQTYRNATKNFRRGRNNLFQTQKFLPRKCGNPRKILVSTFKEAINGC